MQFGYASIKTHELSRALKIRPDTPSAADKLRGSTQVIKRKPKLIVTDVLMKLGNQSFELRADRERGRRQRGACALQNNLYRLPPLYLAYVGGIHLQCSTRLAT